MHINVSGSCCDWWDRISRHVGWVTADLTSLGQHFSDWIRFQVDLYTEIFLNIGHDFLVAFYTGRCCSWDIFHFPYRLRSCGEVVRHVRRFLLFACITFTSSIFLHGVVLTVSATGWYHTRRPMHCYHFWCIVHPHLSSNHFWLINQRSLVIASRDT